jgi:hypothetical protein
MGLSPSRRARPGASQGTGFIGDYFGLAISQSNVYTFDVSTHYPSQTVVADDGGPVYYQNMVLGTVPRSTFGAAFDRDGHVPAARRDAPDLVWTIAPISGAPVGWGEVHRGMSIVGRIAASSPTPSSRC